MLKEKHLLKSDFLYVKKREKNVLKVAIIEEV